MANAKKVCRVCGKEYTACRTVHRGGSVFHWQEVACSPDCGEEYLRRVIAARTPKATDKKAEVSKKNESASKQTVTKNIESAVVDSAAEEI